MATKSNVNGQDVYTTVYQNFAGVDFTNDASNCWYRRSPDAVNMLPDEAGNPFKRTGWTIEKSAEEISTLIGKDDVSIERTAYFELGGNDYILLFTNYGLVLYNGYGMRHLSEFLSPDKDEYGDEVTTTRTWTDFSTLDSLPNSERSFFFEGNGEAGFYMFSSNRVFKIEYYIGSDWSSSHGAQTTSLEKVRVVEKCPTPPLVIIGAEPDTGAGTMYESVNLLSNYRSITYYCEVLTLVLPSPCEEGKIRVYSMQPDGAWKKLIENTDFTIESNQYIAFTSIPKVPAEGDDNIKVTYCPSGGARQAEKVDNVVSGGDMTVTQTKTYYEYYNPTTKKTNWLLTSTTIKCDPIVCNVENIAYDNTGKREYTLHYAKYERPETYNAEDYFKISFAKGKATISLIYDSSGAVNFPPDAYFEEKTTTTTYDYLFEAMGVTPPAGTTLTNNIKYVTTKYVESVSVWYSKYKFTDEAPLSNDRNAFMSCNRNAIYGNGIVNQVFFTSSQTENYSTRIWWSTAQNPLCFPDVNYTEIGSTDKKIMGLMKVGEYLAVIKHSNGSSLESSVHIIYPTSFDENTTYAEKQKVSGIGAVCQYGFNTLNSEALFVSAEGVMAVDINDEDISVKDRSYYVNGKLMTEDLPNAYSFTWQNMYFLSIGNRCYVLDGSQRNSWGNDKNNLVYECYYLENVPASCFARLGNKLFFADYKGNLCRFKNHNEPFAYHDSYADSFNDDCEIDVSVSGSFTVDIDRKKFAGATSETVTFVYNGSEWTLSNYEEETVVNIADYGMKVNGTVAIGDTITLSMNNSPVHIEKSNENIEVSIIEYSSYGTTVFTYDEGEWTPSNSGIFTASGMEDGDTVEISRGVPILARWATIADDDGTVNRFKTMQKNGCVVSLLPSTDSGVDIYYKKDNETRTYITTSDAKDAVLPTDVYIKKKAKKYKRLQIILENNVFDDSFGVDQIIKCYTVGNYSKNRGV